MYYILLNILSPYIKSNRNSNHKMKKNNKIIVCTQLGKAPAEPCDPVRRIKDGWMVAKLCSLYC